MSEAVRRTRGAMEKLTLAIYLNGKETWTLELLAETRLSGLAELLCEEVISKIRPDDWDPISHVWSFILGEAGTGGRTRWNERRRFTSPQDDSRWAGADEGLPNSRLEALGLSARSRIRFEYDMGDTTRVSMKVVCAGEPSGGQGLPLLTPASLGAGREVLRGTNEWTRLLAAVPAWAGCEVRLDHAYPRLAARVLHLPDAGVGSGDDDDDDDDEEEEEEEEWEEGFAPATEFLLGLSAKERSEEDATFLALGTNQSDLLFAPVAFGDLGELLTLAETALRPDPTLRNVRAGWATHFLFPATLSPKAEEVYETGQRLSDPYGPARRFHRTTLTGDVSSGTRRVTRRAVTRTAAAQSALSPQSPSLPLFDFALAFPRTHAQLTCGRFRWFKYEPVRKALTVCVGRGVGPDRRSPSLSCRVWKAKFESLHELFCAVEASWVHPFQHGGGTGGGYELSADALLQGVDDDLGPRCPLPPRPRCLAGVESASVLRGLGGSAGAGGGAAKATAKVTAMLLAVERRSDSSSARKVWHASYGAATNTAVVACGDARFVLFVGLEDGHVEKWALEPETLCWRTLAHEELPLDEEEDDEVEAIYDPKRPPVSGLVLGDDGPLGTRQLFSWSCFDHRVKVWDASSGAPLLVPGGGGDDGGGRFQAVVGDEEFGRFAVAVNVVVLVRQPSGRLVLLAGLHCAGGCPLWVSAGGGEPPSGGGEDDDDADDDEEEEDSEDEYSNIGNLLPFDAFTGEALKPWRGHEVPVTALAATASGHVASCSSSYVAHNLLLWDTSGRLLRQIVFNDLKRRVIWDDDDDGIRSLPPTLASAPTIRVGEVSGAAAHGNTLVLLTDFGEGLAVVDLEAGKLKAGKLSLGLHPGYEDSGFSCCLASSANLAAACNGEDHQGAGGWPVSDPSNLHGTALVVDLRSVLGSAQLAAAVAEGEGQKEEASSNGLEEEEFDFGEEKPERGRPDRHQNLGVGVVETALRDGAREELTKLLVGMSSSDPVTPYRETEIQAATNLALAPGWLAAGYDDGTVRMHRVPSGDVSWAHEPGTSASCLSKGAGHCEECNWQFTKE